MNLDFLILNSLIIDGSGNEPFEGDVAVKDGMISAVGRKLPRTGFRVVEGKGLVLSPGFIDTHGHSDISLLAEPGSISKISQGITTEICGNCGLSVFPVSDLNREHLQDLYKQYDVKISWTGVSDYAALMDKARPSINITSLCGHNTLRASAMGYEDTAGTKDQISKMRILLGESLKKGSVGFSTGFLYIPGKFAGRQEVVSLLRTLSKSSKPYTTHLRSEGNQLIESIDDTISSCFEAGNQKLHISHLKTSGKQNWHKIDDALLRISQGNSKGLSITADRYPYTESMTQLSAYLPPPYDKMDDIRLNRLLQGKAAFMEFVSVLKSLPAERWRTLRLISSSAKFARSGFGRTFADFAKDTKDSPAELCARILREDTAGATAASAGMCETNLKRIISRDFTACGSDETARPLDYSLGRSHPRGFGSMPRFINYLRPSMPLERIIRKITSFPAGIFNLKGRGLIARGYAADLVLWDPDTLKDTADFAEPHSLSKGIEKVWVNGILSYNRGAMTGKRGGRYLVCRD